MARTFGAPGQSARHQADMRRLRREELERLERDEEHWDGGAEGEESTGEVIATCCPGAVALHDRRMPGSSANIDHVVLVPSGVWVIDSKRVRGRVKVEDRRDGAQKLTINGQNRTALVHKLTGQLNAVTAAVAELAPRVPVHGAFCFWLPIDRKRDFITVPASGLPVFGVRTINRYPLWHRRQMVRELNTAGTLSAKQADELGELLAARFPPAAMWAQRSASIAPRQPSFALPPAGRPRCPASPSADRPAGSTLTRRAATDTAAPQLQAVAQPGRVSKDAYKAQMEAKRQAAWETAQPDVEAALGCPVPALLSNPLPHDSCIYCHHALWHSRVYLDCIHGQVGHTVPYTRPASVVGALHSGPARAPQWKALTAFLEHLREGGYVDFEAAADRRIEQIVVLADLQHPPHVSERQ